MAARRSADIVAAECHVGPGLLWFVATQLEIVEMSVEQRLKELNIELPKVGSGVSEARGLV